MPFSFDDLAQEAIKSIVINLLWKGTTRLFRYWGRWIDWTSPAGILLIGMNVLYLSMWYLVSGALVAATVM